MEALCETEKQLAQSIEEEKNNLEELPEEVTKGKEQKRNKQAVLPSKVITRQMQKNQQIQQQKSQAKVTSIIPDAELPQWEPQKQQQQICDLARDVLVDDPLAEVQKQREILKNLWTDQEKAVFIEKIALYGTDFAAIAKFLPNKTVKECQHFYYMTKEFDLNAKIRALEENAEQKAKYQTLEAKFAQMLSTQKEEHQQELKQLKDEFAKEMAQLEAKNRKLEEKLESSVEVQTTKIGALEAKVNEFPKMLAEQQKQMSAQFQAQNKSLEQKLKEAEQRAQMEKNQLEEIIRARASQQKMEKFREEMDKNCHQTFKSSGKGGGMAKLTTGGPDAIKQKQQMGTTTSAIPSRKSSTKMTSAKRPHAQQQKEQSSSNKLPTSSTISQPPSEKKKKRIDVEAINILAYLNGKDGIAKLTTGPAAIKQKQQKAISNNLNESKILANPKSIVWDASKTTVSISECGLKATKISPGWHFAIATEGYAFSGEHCRKENFQFLGTIVFYYETKITWNRYWYSLIGFTDGSKPPTPGRVGSSTNFYGIESYDAEINCLWLSGKKHKLDCPTGVIADGDVIGCGLLLNSKNEFTVFFTLNGILLVKQTPINPTVDRLYPAISFFMVRWRPISGTISSPSHSNLTLTKAQDWSLSRSLETHSTA